MSANQLLPALRWTVAVPVLAAAVLIASWGTKPPTGLLVVIAGFLAASVLAGVHHAEVTSFNLAFGSAMASIGLTIPAIAIASIWLDGPLVLGLGATQMVLLAITVVVGALTVLPGHATIQEGGVHLVLFGAFLFLAMIP